MNAKGSQKQEAPPQHAPDHLDTCAATTIKPLVERFDAALFVAMQNLGAHLISRLQDDLTPGQVFMLNFIRQEGTRSIGGDPHQETEQHTDGRCTVSRLAQMLDVNPSAITVMLDRLENHGYVTRSRDTNDRRLVLVNLSESGERALDRILEKRRRVVGHCLSQFDPDALHTLVSHLEQLAELSQSIDAENLAKLAEGVTQPPTEGPSDSKSK